MGSGGVTNHGTNNTEERSLKKTGKPNSKVQRYRYGKLVQERWYDNNGNAIRNRDYSHSGPYPFPHDHIWEDGERGTEHLSPDYENFN